MTEQSKIPLPAEGKSLFERAEELFGFDGFAAPPVPEGVADAVVKRPSRKGASPPAEPRPFDHTSALSEAPSPAIQVAEPAPEPELEAIRFSGSPKAIDRARLAEQSLIQPEGKITALLEEFRIVKRQLLLSARAARRAGSGVRAQRVLVCSPLPGEGKTFCATNLALAIAAEKDSEVLLVDADFAKPSILSTLGLPAGRGLMDALADATIRVEECVIATDVPGLFVLPAGSTTNSDSEYLASARTAEVLDRLTQGAPNRMVIFDSPPALAASPAAELAKHVGQALVVARADMTGQSALEDALSLLSSCPDIKLLLNAVHFSPSGRRFGTYYGYGE
uniref:AAA family ATPase n=1 Tax=Altererythrobacter segetis TaxID=1104773 RepID=UPI0014083801|nr:AAA family ATPase [Altererythrobacter segetis]